MFKPITAFDINQNLFKSLAKDWMLITAGTVDNYNNMTASWGSFGHLWNKNIVQIYVRPQRHTLKFIEDQDYFTINFFKEEYKDALKLSGSKSGRDINKMTDLGLTAFKSIHNSVFYEESSIQMECKKIYFQDINPENFLDSEIIKNYPLNDFHRMFIGEITEILTKS